MRGCCTRCKDLTSLRSRILRVALDHDLVERAITSSTMSKTSDVPLMPPSGALLSTFDPSTRHGIIRSRQSELLRERLAELVENNGELPSTSAPGSATKRRRSSVDVNIASAVEFTDPAHALDLVITGEGDASVDNKSLKALLKASRKNPFMDSTGLEAGKVKRLAMAAWEDDAAPKVAKARVGWEDECVVGFCERVRYGRRVLGP